MADKTSNLPRVPQDEVTTAPVLPPRVLDRLATESGWPKNPDGSLVPLDTLPRADAYAVIDGMMRRVQALLADPRMREKIAHVCTGGEVQ